MAAGERSEKYGPLFELLKGVSNIEEVEEPKWLPETSGTVAFILFIIGLVCNTLTIMVLRKRNSLGTRLLLYLTYADVAVILLMFFLTVLPILLPRNSKTVTTYRFLIPFLYPFLRTAVSSEMCITVLVAVQRTLILAVPLKYIHFTRDAITNRALIAIAVLSVIYNIPEWLRVWPEEYWNNSLNMTLLRRSNGTTLGASYYVARIIFDNVVPFGLILCCNITMVVSEMRSPLAPGQELRRRGRHQLTNIVIAITTMSVLFHMIVTCLYCVAMYRQTEIVYYLWHSLANIIFLNSSINFSFYCLFGPQFRQTLRSLCLMRKRKRSNAVEGVSLEASLSYQYGSTFSSAKMLSDDVDSVQIK